MNDFKLKIETFPTRCEICHQSDYFVPETNKCSRCSRINESLFKPIIEIPKIPHFLINKQVNKDLFYKSRIIFYLASITPYVVITTFTTYYMFEFLMSLSCLLLVVGIGMMIYGHRKDKDIKGIMFCTLVAGFPVLFVIIVYVFFTIFPMGGTGEDF